MIEDVWTSACAAGTCVEVQWTGCVEVAEDGGRYLVRDSKDPDGPWLTFDADEWAEFVAGVKEGKFDVRK